MKTQKGITLIALIITIIVMLILVGVSVSVALNTGLFKTAQGVAKNTQAERVNETKLSEGKVTIGKTEYESLNDYVEGKQSVSALKLGDAVSYEQTFTDNWPSVSKWTVLSNRDGEVTLCAVMEIDDYRNYLSQGETMPSTFNSNNEISLLTDIGIVPGFGEFLEQMLGHSNGLVEAPYGIDASVPIKYSEEAISTLESIDFRKFQLGDVKLRFPIFDSFNSSAYDEYSFCVQDFDPRAMDGEYEGFYCGNSLWCGTGFPFLIWATVEDGCKVTVENGTYTLTK